jgi:hypothetical protein
MTLTSTATPTTARPHLTYNERDPETRQVVARCQFCSWSQPTIDAIEALELQIAHEQETAAQR